MHQDREKVIKFLREAHANEKALVRTLQAHVGVTPEGSYRSPTGR